MPELFTHRAQSLKVFQASGPLKIQLSIGCAMPATRRRIHGEKRLCSQALKLPGKYKLPSWRHAMQQLSNPFLEWLSHWGRSFHNTDFIPDFLLFFFFEKNFYFFFFTLFHISSLKTAHSCAKWEFLGLLDWPETFMLRQFQLKMNCLLVSYYLPRAHGSRDASQPPPSGWGFAMGTASPQMHYERCTLNRESGPCEKKQEPDAPSLQHQCTRMGKEAILVRQCVLDQLIYHCFTMISKCPQKHICHTTLLDFWFSKKSVPHLPTIFVSISTITNINIRFFCSLWIPFFLPL